MSAGPQFSRPSGRSSWGRTEAGRPGARVHQSVSPATAAGGGTDRSAARVGEQDSDGPARAGPAPRTTPPGAGPAERGPDCRGHHSTHESRFMLPRVAPLGRPTTVRAHSRHRGRCKPLQTLRPYPACALLPRRILDLALILSVKRSASPIFLDQLSKLCTVYSLRTNQFSGPFGIFAFSRVLSVCCPISTRIGSVSCESESALECFQFVHCQSPCGPVKSAVSQ